jgi:hypothetical protein
VIAFVVFITILVTHNSTLHLDLLPVRESGMFKAGILERLRINIFPPEVLPLAPGISGIARAIQAKRLWDTLVVFGSATCCAIYSGVLEWEKHRSHVREHLAGHDSCMLATGPVDEDPGICRATAQCSFLSVFSGPTKIPLANGSCHSAITRHDSKDHCRSWWIMFCDRVLASAHSLVPASLRQTPPGLFGNNRPP